MQELSTTLRNQDAFRFSRLTDLNTYARIGETDINNRGVTAFSGASPGSQDISGIYTTRNGRQTETIANLSTLPSLFQDVTANAASTKFTLGDEVEINNRGDVVFEGSLVQTRTEGTRTIEDTIERLFLKQGNQFKIVGEAKVSQDAAVNQTDRRRINVSEFSLNDRDQVVYKLQESQFINIQNSIISNGQTLITGSSLRGIGTDFENPQVNNDGSIYVYRRTGDSQDGILRFAPGSTTPTIAVSASLPTGEFSVNDRGRIVFAGSTAQGNGIFQLDGSTLTKLNEVNPVTVNGIEMNNRGSISFDETSSNLARIGFIRNGLEQTVISSNDQLAGRQLVNVDRSRLNDRNQIAFTAKFADGTLGVFRADLRRSLSSTLNLANDEIATPEEGETEVALTA